MKKPRVENYQTIVKCQDYWPDMVKYLEWKCDKMKEALQWISDANYHPVAKHHADQCLTEIKESEL